MPPKKATGTVPAKKAAAAPSHPPYKEMIKEAILTLKDRTGSSRQAIKKYILANHKSAGATPAVFDQQFNKALRTGVEKGDFTQPKGASGPVKLAKKEPAKKATSPSGTAPKKTTTTKKAPAAKKATTAKPKTKTTTTKKAPAAKKEKAAKPKANTSTKRKTKTPAAAPAVVDVPKVLAKTKSGRVTKTNAKSPTVKKTVTKKAAPKKASTPKKAAAASA